MPKRNWGNGLAFGLIVSICLATFYAYGSLVAGEKEYQPYEQHSKTYASQNENQKKYPDRNQWWGVAQRFISSEDTLAQWLMTFFSLLAVLVSGAAVYWVKLTYDATVAMSADSRKVGEAQVRAYISIADVVVTLDGKTIFVQFSVENKGNSPAMDFDCVFLVTLERSRKDREEVEDFLAMHYRVENTPQYPAFPQQIMLPLSSGERKKVQMSIWRLSDSEALDAHENGIRVYLSMATRFSDVFDRTHFDMLHFYLKGQDITAKEGCECFLFGGGVHSMSKIMPQNAPCANQ